MVKLLVYGYCLGVRSSRRIARRLDEDVAFRALATGNRPVFSTISDSRKIHLKALKGLFGRVLRLARESGAPKLDLVALDGTKMKANASKRKAMSWKRMRETEEPERERAAEAGEPEEQACKAKPRDKDQYNFSDPESRIMKACGGMEQAYNAEAAAEPVERQAGRRPTEVSAASGYCSERNL